MVLNPAFKALRGSKFIAVIVRFLTQLFSSIPIKLKFPIMTRLISGGDASPLFHVCQSNLSTLDQSVRLPMCSIGFNLLSKSSPVESVTEKKTGVTFPGEFCLTPSHCTSLAGVGTRQKRLAGIKSLDVYALALYVDESGARSTLHKKTSAKDEGDFVKDQGVYTDLINARRVEKNLMIVITSGLVKRKSFVEALNEQLEPPVTGTKSMETLSRFREQFDTIQFRKGLEISFTCHNGTLTTKVDGKKLGDLKDAYFTDALLNIYLGDKPVSESAKRSFGQGLYKMAC